MRRARPRSSDLTGLPFLPPAEVVALVSRVRSSLERVRAALLPPPVAIIDASMSLLDHRVLVMLCEAGVPDALDGPTLVEDLAEQLGVDAERLARALAFAAARGWVEHVGDRRFRASKVTTFLRKDHASGWRAFVDLVGGPDVVRSVEALSLEPGGRSPFQTVHGMSFYDWLRAHPDRWATFDSAQAATGRLHALALDRAIDWSAFRSVCDLGGGTGSLLAGILDRRPHLVGTVFDQPEVVQRAILHERLSTIGGDLFVDVPGGFDAYLLVNVLHNWSDRDAEIILKTLARTIGDAVVYVVESVATGRHRQASALRVDLMMAALFGEAGERDEAGYRSLAARGGLDLGPAVRLASGDVAYEMRAARLAPAP